MGTSRRQLFGVLLALVALGTVSVGDTHAAFPGGNGRIVFVSVGLGNMPTGIRTMAPDGSNNRAIWAGSGSRPSWSPDGTTIVFQAGFGNDAEIRVMDADGLGERTVAADPESDRSPSWSPDGTKVLYERIVKIGTRKHAIPYVVGVDGSKPTRLPMPIPCAASLGYCEPHPVWSATGRIALVSDRSGSPQIWSMNPDGSDARQVTSAPGTYLSWDWSPDGNKLAFTRLERDSSMHLFVVNADGTSVVDLTSALGPYRQGLSSGAFAAWSPDGLRIAIDSSLAWSVSGHLDVYSMNPDGNGMTRLTTDGASIAPSWQPVSLPRGTPGLAPDPQLEIARRAVRLSRIGDARIRVTCARGGPGGVCAGTLQLTSASRVKCGRSNPRRVALGAAPFRIEQGHSARVRVRLTRRNRKLVACLRRVRVRAAAGVPRLAGGVAHFNATFMLRAR